MANETGAMFDEFVQGGLLDDADVLVKTARFSTWDYNGKQPQPVLAIKLVMEDGEAAQHEQYLSGGELRFFVPSTDGRLAVPVGNQTKLNLNTNAVAFILSLLNAATDADFAAKLRATGDISLIEGMRMHVLRKAQPKRAGIIQAPGTEGQPQREKTYLTCERIISYPGQAAPAAGTKAAAPAASAAAPAAVAGGNEELDGQTMGVLFDLLNKAGGSLLSTAIAGKVFGDPDLKKLPNAERNAILGLIVKPEFLGAEGRPWTFDPTTKIVKLA